MALIRNYTGKPCIDRRIELHVETTPMGLMRISIKSNISDRQAITN